MRPYLATILFILGCGLVVIALLLGVTFGGVLLKGYIGTGGREAGGEFMLVLLITVVGCLLGYSMVRGSKRLAETDKSER